MEVNDLCAPTTVIRKNWCIGTRAIAARGAEEKIFSAPTTDSAGYYDNIIQQTLINSFYFFSTLIHLYFPFLHLQFFSTCFGPAGPSSGGSNV